MKDNEMYYGITIGPIVKTLCMPSTPGGLWLASYMFSYIAKRLIVQIKEAKGNILIPSFEENDKEEEVGSYPDHIIFIADENLDINKIIKEAKEEIGNLLYEAFTRINKKDKFLTGSFDNKDINDFVNEYINVHCIKTKNIKNIMIEISEILDNVEQFNSYVYKEKENYFLTLFNGIKIDESNKVDDKDKKDAKNIYIKKFFKTLNDDKENNTKVKPQVLFENDEDNIKSVDDIARIKNKEDYKISDYLAIIQADGDGMTELFKNMGNDTEKVKEFSKSCIEYTNASADLIKKYGGVTIYAGGDDLLFLAPIESKNGNKNILDLCDDIREKFDQSGIEEASISFGIAINYRKFPLYESFNQAREMLYRAKKLSDKKNSIAINLTKASGLSVFLNFGNETEALNQFKNLINNYYISNEKSEKIKDSTNSVIYLMDNYRDLYDIASNNKDKKEIKNFFTNMYSNPMQENYQKFIKDITNLFIQAKNDKENNRFKSIIENDSNKDENTELSSMLRFAKFLVEKGGKSDE